MEHPVRGMSAVASTAQHVQYPRFRTRGGVERVVRQGRGGQDDKFTHTCIIFV